MKLEQIKMKLAQMLLQMATIKTDKAILEYDGEELAVDVAVYVADENGERIVAEDGEYVTEEGKTIVVADGKVAEIKEKEEEEKPAEEEEVTEEVEADEEVTEDEKPTEETVDEIAKIKEDIAKINDILNSILEKMGKNADEVEARLSKVEQMSASKTIELEFEAIKGMKNRDAKIDTKLKRVEEMSKNWRNI